LEEIIMRVLSAMFAAILLVGADAPADVVKKDLGTLDGDWVMVSGERDGQAIPDEYLKKGKRVFKDGEVTVTLGDMLLMTAKVSLDPGKKPKTIDYDVSDGFFKGRKQLGIYEIDGDTAKFCFTNPDKERPIDFTAKPGSGRTLSVWKREKK
jgi:uncharacterized protein (TIGR03067 family)